MPVPQSGSDIVHTSDPVHLLGFPDYATVRPAWTEEVVANPRALAGEAPHHRSRQRRLDLHLAGDAPLSGQVRRKASSTAAAMSCECSARVARALKGMTWSVRAGST